MTSHNNFVSQQRHVGTLLIGGLTISTSNYYFWWHIVATDKYMSRVSKIKFPVLARINTETSSSLKLKSLLYSECKFHMAWKSLVGISFASVTTYVIFVVVNSELVKTCDPDDYIMDDKIFTISDLTTLLDILSNRSYYPLFWENYLKSGNCTMLTNLQQPLVTDWNVIIHYLCTKRLYSYY